METYLLSFPAILVSGLACFLFYFGTNRYRNAINPLVVFALFDIGLLTLLSSGVVDEYYDGQDVGLAEVLYLAIVYLAGFVLIFLPQRFNLPRLLFDEILTVIGKRNTPANYGVINQALLLAFTTGLFVLLMEASGAGMLWLTEPRQAYQLYRAGVGFIYLMVQWTLLVAMLYYLWTCKPKLPTLILVVCIYTVLVYFTGSKANLLAGIILAGVYYNFFIRRISTLLILCSPFVILGSLMILLVHQGSYDEVLSSLMYFSDYTETTAQFLRRFDEFELQWGYATLSELWFYVPRALYPDKPFEYGLVLIDKALFPGAAELGSTPGVLPWATAYLDFGLMGVFISGVVTGFIRRGAYESYLANRSNVVAFVLMIQLSLIPVFAYATLPLTILIGALLASFMRKKIVFVAAKQSLN